MGSTHCHLPGRTYQHRTGRSRSRHPCRRRSFPEGTGCSPRGHRSCPQCSPRTEWLGCCPSQPCQAGIRCRTSLPLGSTRPHHTRCKEWMGQGCTCRVLKPGPTPSVPPRPLSTTWTRAETPRHRAFTGFSAFNDGIRHGERGKIPGFQRIFQRGRARVVNRRYQLVQLALVVLVIAIRPIGLVVHVYRAM